jgi:two-component system, NarL family, sensor histidine kinase UhpB
MISAPTSDPMPRAQLRAAVAVPVAQPALARSGARRLWMSRPWRDAIVVAVVTLAAAVVSTEFNLSERLHRITASWERVQLDELPDVLWVLSIGLAWYAVRRYRDAGRDLECRRIAESQLAGVLVDNRRLSQQYIELQESERKSLARELHDELGQYLNVIKLDAVGIRDARSMDARAARDLAAAIVENCNHIHGVLADLIGKLRPVGLDELGLAAAIEHCVETWRPRLSGTEITLAVRGEWMDLPEDVALTAYRVVQEALTNVAKHTSASAVTVEVDRKSRPGSPNGELHIAVTDDGIGKPSGGPSRGLGLIGMKERVTALAGELDVVSLPGRGFQLKARLPVHPS